MEQKASMEIDGKNLLAAHCQGEPTAFEQIVRRHGNDVFRFLRRMSGNQQEAEDFFQETFKRVHQKASTFKEGRLRSWIFKIATNVAIDGYRRKSRIKTLSLNQKFDGNQETSEDSVMFEVADNSMNPSDEAIKAEQTKEVRRIVSSLPAGQRATLVLAYYQQLSYSEVADVLGCSLGTVKTQMSRALQTLARKLPDIAGGVK